MKAGKSRVYRISGKVWLYSGASASWHFFTIPKKESSMLKEVYKGHTRGWGSLPVEVILGKTSWNTSIFPESKSGTYILPIKALVRRKEGVYEGDACTISFQVAL
jgi:Domain of unknown function (DUF1905)